MTRKHFKIYFALATLMLLMVPQSAWASYRAIATKGKLPGAFSVSPTKQVWFSQGNLQYQADNGDGGSTWRFAINQYDFVGDATHGNVYLGETKCDNANISSTYTGWIDLFGWATSGNSASGTAYQPWSISTTNSDYGPAISSSEWTAADSDWGVVNAEQLGSGWRALTKAEWVYLIKTRTNASSLHTFATVNGVVGLILMPDGWTANGVSLTITTANYTSNNISLADWNTLESQGCVFLPSAGYRGGDNNTTCDLVQDHGSYWSSTAYSSEHAYYLDVKTGGLDPNYHNNRHIGLSVRLVSETMFPGSGTAEDPYIINSEATWNYLAETVNTGNTYSGKYFQLTEDISVTMMVGNSDSNSFRGTFDGGGHTLNITYSNDNDYTAPFRYIQGATFKNLKVTGSITTTMNLAAGIAGLNTGSAATFEQCATDVTINSSSTTIVGWGRVDYHGGLLARTNDVNVNITDCFCGGSVDGSDSPSSIISYDANFVGVAVGCTVTGTRCLSTTSYTNVNTVNPLCHAADANRSVDVFYYVNGNDVCDGATQVTLSDLNNSSYATALQADRPTTVWVQYLRTNQPMLKQFTKYTVTYHVNGGSGSVPAAQDKQQGDDMMLSNSTLTRDGFAHTGWNTNSDGTGTHYDLGGTYTADADVTLYAEWDFQGSGTEEEPYLIPSTEVWNFLANKVNSGTNYSGKYFRQTADISVTTMVGNSETNSFRGTFDGYGHTLTFNISASEDLVAPFRYINGATIKNLIVNGTNTSSGRQNSGLVALSDGATIITNCVVSATLTNNVVHTSWEDGNSACGGFIAEIHTGSVTFNGCRFSGSILGSANSFGGFVGWLWGNDGQFNNCLFDPTALKENATDTKTYCRDLNGHITFNNSYYRTAFGDSQGKQVYTITAGTDVTINNLGDGTEYDVSGITAYTHGIKYNGIYYAGNGDEVSLNLTATDHTGYSPVYSADNGTVAGSGNPYTLTMPAANVIINARYSVSKSINKYTQDGHDGWYLIASPIGTVNPANVTNMTSNTFDIFRFNQNPTVSGGLYLEWENWKKEGTSHYHFNLEPGRGYLYANSSNVTLTFVGTPYSGDGKVTLVRSNSNGNTDSRLLGWNLIGNPFGTTATINKEFYRINDETHAELILAEGNSVAPMEGIFVYAENDCETVTFNTSGAKGNESIANHIVINLSQNASTPSTSSGTSSAGTIIDRAIVSFDEGRTLPKFQINESSTKLYIPQNGADYAIAFSDRTGEMPLNFKAAKNGSYTLTVDAEDIEAGYLHLIDNMTGANVDLLVQPSYTFNAKTTDYESRFKLVFAANGPSAGSGSDEPFAYISDGEIIINGEGTVQVIDMLGHQLLSKEKTSDFRLPTSGFSSGVYVLRLITSSETKTQKIVVKD